MWQRTFQLDESGGNAVAGGGFDFKPIASRGQIVVTYTIDSTGVGITVRPVWLARGYSEVGILNEQSAAFNDFAADGSPTLIGASFGRWIAVDGRWARLRAAGLGVEWSVPGLPGATLHGGREISRPDFDWAGLDYIFPATFAGISYQITVQEAR
jgi:hypothetical protein